MVVGESQVPDLLDAIAMPWTPVQRHHRDATFRSRILDLYDGTCAACGYAARLGHMALGIDAAHVRALAYGGNNQDDNGLALCAIHHRAFDLGAIGIDPAMRWAASGKLRGIVGSPAVAALFGQLQGSPVLPSRQGGLPAKASVDWHWRNVFVQPPLAPLAR